MGAATQQTTSDGARGRRRIALARALVREIRPAIADPALEIVVGDPVGAPDTGKVGAPVGAPDTRPVGAPDTRPVGAPDTGKDGAPRGVPTIVLRGPDAVGRLVLSPTADAFAEGYLRGDLDIHGDVMAAVEAGGSLDLRRLRPSAMRRIGRWGLELYRGTPAAPPLRRVARLAGTPHSPARDMAAVRFHYDVGESFFSLWLDRRLTYSCAYFPDGTTAADAPDRLDAAQEAKLDLVARKLRLGPGARLLDIGCGWGSLVIRAAESTGCDATGITLSERQTAEANALAAAGGLADGLADRARVEVRDYRDLAPLGTFDAVASVGMFEHVGRANLPSYFRAAYNALRPGGLFLNHGIAGVRVGRRPARARLRPRTGRFIDRYVFPDGELVPVDEAIAHARAAGFEVIDVQSLRPHYALTLAAWVARLEARWDEAVAAAGEEVARTWRLYMSASRLGFEQGAMDVCQLLLARPGQDAPAHLPLRPWW